MYVPKHFAVDDPAELRRFMEQHGFATVVTAVDGVPFASHLPLILDPSTGPYGTLTGHLARANPHWRHFAGAISLAIFNGPHAYVSPSWYTVTPSVPTWNYATIHAYGEIRAVIEPERSRAILQRSIEREERAAGTGWSMASLDPGYLEHMQEQIVAFELPIARIEGKFKLSQNRTPADRDNVAAALGGEIGRLMQSVNR